LLRRLKKKIGSLFTKDQGSSIRIREITAETKKEEQKKAHKVTTREKVRTSPPKEKVRKVQVPNVIKKEKKVFEPWDPSAFTAEPAEGKVRFQDLGLTDELLRAVYDLGFSYCTDIQGEILPNAFKGRDVSGKAQTGTGKTAAFLLASFRYLQLNPVENRKPGMPRVLVLAPTRELVLQIEKDALDLSKYTDIEVLAVFGGMGYDKQRRALEEKIVDVVVATPGRLLDFRQNSKVNLSGLDIVVIDEADRMLDMGFIPDIRKIMNFAPPKENRQTMLFSATLTPLVAELASRWTKEPFTVEIEPENITNTRIEQVAYIVSNEEKFKLLYNYIIDNNLKSVIIFCNRRDQTRNLSDKLYSLGIECRMLSGDVSQTKRIKTLEEFRTGVIQVLVATDVAARGIHVDGVTHVFNYNLPEDPDSYVHRIGRTARAGASGTSVIFACEDEAMLIPALEEHTGVKMNYINPEESLLRELPQQVRKPEKKERSVIRSGGRGSVKTGGRQGGKRPPRGRTPKKVV
jgi:ATP-dependent RNA helicase RhlB